MSNESESSDLDRDVDASMRMFEKSKVGPAAAIVPATLSRVLLVLDGSPQDETGCQSARFLAQRFGCQILVLDARDAVTDDQQDLAVAAAATLPNAACVDRAEGDSYDAILAAIDQHPADLLMVPCPFGRCFERVGADSAGTVIDVLLSRCRLPMLVTRREDQALSECVDQISMVLGGECDVESRAASWVFALAAEQATITLNLVIEKENFENIRSIVEALAPGTSLAPEQFSDALTKTHQAIHNAMARTAREKGLTYHLRPQAGEVAPPNPLANTSKLLLVMPLEVDDRFGQGFVQDRIRRSPHPVLVVPGHVRQ